MNTISQEKQLSDNNSTGLSVHIKNILFYKPNNQLTYYFISRFLYENKEKDIKIYVVLENDLLKKTGELWKDKIESYDLNHYYIDSYKNLLLINEEDLKEKEVIENIKLNIKTIFYVLNENIDNQLDIKNYKKKFMKDIKILNKLKITIFCGIPNNYYVQNTKLNDFYKNYIKKYILKNIKNRIFYLNDYVGENKRGIINKKENIQLYFNYIKEVYLNKKYNNDFDYLYLDDMESLYELFVMIYEGKIKIEKQEFIFNNIGKIELYDKTFTNDLKIENLTQPYSLLKNYLKDYHESLYIMHKNEDIDKIIYDEKIDFKNFLLKTDYHSNEKLIPSLELNLFSGLLAFISLNLIFIISLLIILYLIYFRKAYNKYILLTIILIILKSPLLIEKTGEFIKNLLTSLFKYFSGKVIFEDETRIKNDEKYIYIWNPHHYVPLGSFLSIVSDEFKNIMNKKKNIVNVCHEFLVYFPYISHFLDYLNFKACSKNNIQNELNKNNSIGLWLGGRTEMFYVEENKDIIYLNQRRGIFEMSIKNKVSLIPTFTFGDNQNYTSELIETNLYFLKHPFVLPTWKGLYDELKKMIQIFRKKPEYLTIIGNPIIPPELKENEEITDKMIEEYRNKYIKELKKIYEKYKNMRYSVPKKLNII